MLLTSAMRKIGRRNFLKAAGGVSALAVLGTTAVVRGPRRGGPVRAALIGYGKQGRLLRGSIAPDLMNIVAICDIKPPANEDTAQLQGAKWFQDWRRLLQEQPFEAVLIATPPCTHAGIASACLDAGKHVFCETAMSLDVTGCHRMILASQNSRRILHVGYQDFYEPAYWAAYRNIVKQGLLGEVYSVEAACHTSNSGRLFNEPGAPTFDPRPWGYSSSEHLLNWRLYRGYSSGLMGESGGALVSLMNWFLQDVPVAVQAKGGTYSYKDGRDVDDHVFATLEYPNGRTATLSVIQSNGFEASYTQFMGTNGTLIIGKDEALLFTEGGRKQAALKAAKVNASQPVIDTSASRSEEASSHSSQAQGTSNGQAGAAEAFQRELAAFCGAIRTGAPIRCSPEHACDVALTCLTINDAIEKASLMRPQDLHASSHSDALGMTGDRLQDV
jgi:predicted dehydrogenase